jgi:hypothetical protein
MITIYQRMPIALRRGLFVVVHAVVVTAIFSFAVKPWLDRRDRQIDQIADLGAQLHRIKQLAAREREAQELLSRARFQLDGGAFWTGDSESAVSAAIQAAVRDFGSESRLRLRSIRGIQAQIGENAPRTAQVRIDAHGDLAAIHGFLTLIEQATPFLFGHSLAIRNPLQGSPSTPLSEPMLELQLDIIGYFRRGPT